jgi:hypothetical protein
MASKVERKKFKYETGYKSVITTQESISMLSEKRYRSNPKRGSPDRVLILSE